MNIRLNLLLSWLALFAFTIAYAQEQMRIGLLPSVNVNRSPGTGWELNLAYESRHFTFQQTGDQPGDIEYKYSLSDFSVLAGAKAGFDSKVAGGILLRLEPGATSYRTIQHFIISSRAGPVRFAHRISSDQTFSSSELPDYRFRYRITAEVPLQGEKVDVREFYFKISNEFLNSIHGNDYGLEIRLVPVIGYVPGVNHRFEAGPGSRLNNFIDDGGRFTTWLALKWYIKV